MMARKPKPAEKPEQKPIAGPGGSTETVKQPGDLI